MRFGVPGAVLGLLLAVSGGAKADEAEANRLLVEAVRLAEQAMRASRADAVGLYERAVANLDAIVADHPDSTYAALIATNQPVGSFLPWQVRHELARLTAPAAQRQDAEAGPLAGPCDGGPCVWRRQYGDGTGNMLTGDGEAYMLADVLPRPDGSVVVVGTHWADRARKVWVSSLDATGATVWEQQYRGTSCDAASFDGGFVLLAEDLDERPDVGVHVLDGDGQRQTHVSVDYDAYAVTADGEGGFLIAGRQEGEPFVEARTADGARLWSWTVPATELPNGRGRAGVVALATGPDGVRLLGYQMNAEAGDDMATLWMGTLDANRELDLLATLAEFRLVSRRTCDFVSRDWSMVALGDDWLIRYTAGDPNIGRKTTVARVGSDGTVAWSRTHPSPASEQPDPQAAIEAGVDDITAVSATRDGGVLVAGFRNRPAGRGVGFVALWDGDGEEVWRSEVRTAEPETNQERTFFAAVEETADGGTVAVMTDGMQTFRIRAFVLHLDGEGTMP